MTFKDLPAHCFAAHLCCCRHITPFSTPPETSFGPRQLLIILPATMSLLTY